MIPSYINDWLTIIETMSNQNTYKLAWGRSIIEYVNLNEIDDINITADNLKRENKWLNVILKNEKA